MIAAHCADIRMALVESGSLTGTQQTSRTGNGDSALFDRLDSSEKLERCAQLCRLVIEGGYYCFAKLFQLAFSTPAEFYNHLRTPLAEKQLRRINVLHLLDDDELQMLYSATDDQLDSLFFKPQDLATPGMGDLTVLGDRLRRLSLLLKYLAKSANDEDFDHEVQAFRVSSIQMHSA